MLSEPRAIVFRLELELPPIDEIKVGKETVRALYNKLCEPDGYAYENLDLQAQIPTLSTRRPDGESICQLGGYKLIVEERNPEIHDVDSFIQVVQTILRALGTDFPPFIIQRVRIECLAQPHGAEDSIDLLVGRLTNVAENMDPFERPALFFGVRFRFPPRSVMEDDDDENREHSDNVGEESPGAETAQAADDGNVCDESFVQLRFETYSKDVSQVWMEAAATYVGPRPAQDVQGIGDNILGTYKFLAEKAKRFLDQFDHKSDEGGGK